MVSAVQQKIDALSSAVAKGDLIDTDLNVVSKNGWKWTILKVVYSILQPFYSCFGKDVFQPYRIHHVAQAVLKLCQQNPDLNLTLKAKVVANILGPLDLKTKSRYTKDVEAVKNSVLTIGGVGQALGQRKILVQNALNRFAHQLHLRLAANAPTSVCFAPISLAPVLGMILKGLSEERKAVFLQGLGLDLPEPIVHLAINELSLDLSKANGPLCSIRTANALAAPASAEIYPEYRQGLTSYNAESFSVSEDPAIASQAINHWVSEKTNGHIKDLVNPNDLRSDDPSGTFFALLNGVYFDGKWETDFNNSVDDQFTFAAAGPMQVKMMSLGKTLSCYVGDTFRMLEIPYKSPQGHELTHLVFLPNEGHPLPLLENRLTPNFIAHCRQNARRGYYNVKMPKIDVNVKLTELLDTLQQMGLPVTGHLDQLGNQAELRKIIHQAKVKVDEKGTVAVAATAAIGMCRSTGPRDCPPPDTFYINRDYAYYIMDNSQILFQGNVKDPAALVR